MTLLILLPPLPRHELTQPMYEVLGAELGTSCSVPMELPSGPPNLVRFPEYVNSAYSSRGVLLGGWLTDPLVLCVCLFPGET